MTKIHKIAVAALVACVAFAGFAVADTTTIVTNALGQVVTVTKSTDGLEQSSSITLAAGPATTPVRTSVAVGPMLLDTNTIIAPTRYTPYDIGTLLLGLVSNKLYIATDSTTNGWTALN